jgi:hypothetical protein
MKKATAITAVMILLPNLFLTANAMPPEQIKPVLNMTKDNWVSFRDYNGKQLIYFTHLETYKCGIEQVRYSINSDSLDQTWELEPCDPKNPLKITKEIIYLTLPPGTAKSIAVKLTFIDNSESEIVHKSP